MNSLRASLVFGVLLLLAGCGGPVTSGPAPEFSLLTLKDGGKASSADFKGKPLVIDFWATWCAPCRESLPEVQALAREYGPKGVKVIGVSSEDASVVGPFVEDRKLGYPIYLDSNEKTARAFGVDAFPTMVVINRDGSVVYFDAPPNFSTVRATLDQMLK